MPAPLYLCEGRLAVGINRLTQVLSAPSILIESTDSDPSRQGFYHAFHIGGRVKEEVIVDIGRDLTEIARRPV